MTGGQAGATLRWTRALVLAAVTWSTGTVGHLAAGGELPGAPALALLLATAAVAVAPLLGRELGAGTVIGLLVGGQSAVHGALSALTTAGAAGAGASPARAGHAGHQAVAADPAWVHHLLGGVLGPDVLMGLGHLGAAVVVGWWLAAGERAAWTLLQVARRPVADLLRALRALLAWLPPVAGASTRRVPSRPAVHGHSPSLVVLDDSIPRRGPPVAVG